MPAEGGMVVGNSTVGGTDVDLGEPQEIVEVEVPTFPEAEPVKVPERVKEPVPA